MLGQDTGPTIAYIWVYYWLIVSAKKHWFRCKYRFNIQSFKLIYVWKCRSLIQIVPDMLIMILCY